MKHLSFALFLLLLCFSCEQKTGQMDTFAADAAVPASAVGQTDGEQQRYSRLELPRTNPKVSSKELQRTGYAVSYNPTWRIPNWVAYELTRGEASARGKREGGFESDPAAGRGGAEPADYKHSGYSRGHMAPAGDMKWNHKAMRETFLLTNICPQNYDLNAGVWEDLESALRDRARQWGNVYIVCGPVVSPGYKTIGRNRVCVPQHFFKVACWKYRDEWRCKAFIFPNKNAGGRFHDYSTTVDEIERLTGHDFFSALPDRIENEIESRDNRGKW